eukprot:1513275-Prorocentrum_lima.AAC.1
MVYVGKLEQELHQYRRRTKPIVQYKVFLKRKTVDNKEPYYLVIVMMTTPRIAWAAQTPQSCQIQ